MEYPFAFIHYVRRYLPFYMYAISPPSRRMLHFEHYRFISFSRRHTMPPPASGHLATVTLGEYLMLAIPSRMTIALPRQQCYARYARAGMTLDNLYFLLAGMHRQYSLISHEYQHVYWIRMPAASGRSPATIAFTTFIISIKTLIRERIDICQCALL